jgi:hypothetical protein
VHDAVSLAIGQRNRRPWVYKTDISSFFDTIDRERLKAAIRKKVRHRSLHSLLIDAACREIFEPDKYRAARVKQSGIKSGCGVRQGMPLSPLFSNLFLHSFDRLIENSGISMIRYADDLIFLCRSYDECLSTDDFCREHLSQRGLTLPALAPKSKTCICEPGEVAEFLGLGLIPDGKTYKLDLTDDQRQKIKRRLKQFQSPRYLAQNHITIFDFGRKIDGVIAGYLGSYANCASFENLRKDLGQLRSQVTAKLFNAAFGVDISKLDNDSSAFLGLPHPQSHAR